MRKTYLQQDGFEVLCNKRTFGAEKVSFFGYHISTEGVHSLPRKVAVGQNFHNTSTFKILKKFLCLINYYHRLLSVITVTLASSTPPSREGDVALSALLEQVITSSPHTLYLCSRDLVKAESIYSTCDCRLLTVDLAVLPFRHSMEAKKHIMPELHSGTYVFLCKDKSKLLVTPPYNQPSPPDPSYTEGYLN
ncbi:uncharacterized protein [Palaemon carinicauda]|uniref:uncharacterized protein n=1 Tax=Palaemon carinicauda TaxID=392227 RepID=UPI0035B582BF